MPGLHHVVLAVARDRGIDLTLGARQPWLSVQGHLSPVVQAEAPTECIEALAACHRALGGDENALASKRRGTIAPDLIHAPTGTLIEVDERQHFSSARDLTFDFYPTSTPLGFEEVEYRSLIEQWSAKANGDYSHKTAPDFSFPGGRTQHRAYNDMLRDVLAPVFTGRPVIRIPTPDRIVDGAVDRLTLHL